MKTVKNISSIWFFHKNIRKEKKKNGFCNREKIVMLKLNQLQKRTSPPLSDCSILGIMLVASIHSSDLPTSLEVLVFRGYT
jgi:hypothetical protein